MLQKHNSILYSVCVVKEDKGRMLFIRFSVKMYLIVK